MSVKRKPTDRPIGRRAGFGVGRRSTFEPVGRSVGPGKKGRSARPTDRCSPLENSFNEREQQPGQEQPPQEQVQQQLEQDQEVGDGKGGDDFSRYLPLYQAALRGDWETARDFFPDINQLSTTRINAFKETVLHIAVLAGKSNNHFVNQLVEMMPPEALALKNSIDSTALHNAAVVGNKAAALALVRKNRELLHISNHAGRLPVLVAGLCFHEETLRYLISEHEANGEDDPLFQGQLGVQFLNAIIASQFVGIAWDLVQKHPALALLREEDNSSALSTISHIQTLFPRAETFTWWQNFIYHCIPIKKHNREVVLNPVDVENLTAAHSTSQIVFGDVTQKLQSVIWCVVENLVPKVKEMREKKATSQQALQLTEYLCHKIASGLSYEEADEIFKKSIIIATQNGMSEIVETIIHKFPSIMFHRDATGRSIIQVAASYRYENVVNLLYNMSDRKYTFYHSSDNKKNNLLHTCGRLAPPIRLNLVAGAALQMQRELQWFREMENFVHPSRRTWRNKKGETPQMLFTKEHEKLKEDGEKWMKDTATACILSAALIATVMFAAAFTVPGGLGTDVSSSVPLGVPLFSGRGAFKLFAVADTISLFASITSLLMFQSILTARYAEEDFLYVLPKRLSMGLLSLFVSITFMLVAFGATLHLLLRRDMALFPVLLPIFACFPIASLVLLQFPLFVDVVYSTYGPGIFGKKGNKILY